MAVIKETRHAGEDVAKSKQLHTVDENVN